MSGNKRKKSRRRSSSSDDSSSRDRTRSRHSQPPGSRETNLAFFSFLDHKSELNRVLLGFHPREQLLSDINDFWLFMQKYESMLKKSSNCILLGVEEDLDELPKGFPTEFKKTHLMRTRFGPRSVEELLGKVNLTSSKLNVIQIKQFLQIVLHYLEFRQKEKFDRLKKLRKNQADLPVAKFKEEIVNAVRNERVVLLAGDTGCGKSTQIPQYLLQAGYKSIACTQPRRIACISLSKRVACEMLCEFGTKVGYQIRFERSKSKDTNIVFITEGLLLRQLSQESKSFEYDVLVLDEIHERHLHGDFLLGVAKCLIKVRPDLKLVLMSATINLKLFQDYFTEESAHIIVVPGRLHPIKMHYMPPFKDTPIGRKSERLSPEPYIQIMQMIDDKYPTSERGDILIFMSGLNEITTIVDAAKEYASAKNTWIILPLHSSLSIAEQDKVFDYAPQGMRKCIVSTNIAETSVTIDGIRFVVDSGKVKEMSYDSSCKLSRLKEFAISKAAAEQRKGRAGRTGPGVCYRLYTQKEYDDFDEYSPPEIHRVPLESLLLQMVSMGLPNARLFPFIEPPPADSIESSILALKQHEAMTADEKLTTLGLTLSRIPVDICIGKMLLMGCVFSELQPVLTMASALSVQSPFTNRAYRDSDCETARKSLESDHGDPITLLNAFREWLDLKRLGFNQYEKENTKKWCRRRGLEEQRFYEITKLRNQFQELLTDCGLKEMVKPKSLSSAERAIRHGELRQLKELKREHKHQAPQKRKILRATDGMDEDDDGGGQKPDIQDVEFRLSHDPSKMKSLLSGAVACSYRDLMTLKLILVSGIYPQIAIADEFNYCKSPSQHFFHTRWKPFTSLHPMSFFGNNGQVLQLEDSEIIDKPIYYKSKLPLSAKHQLLCYQSLLETNKPYLMNTMRMPAAQTLLLFADTIDANMGCSKFICDSWLCLEFPFPESGMAILQKACHLRNSWRNLLNKRLENMTRKDDVHDSELEGKLWRSLADFMNTEVYYTLNRLLPADLKYLYGGPDAQENDEQFNLAINPFDEEFKFKPNDKGGFYATDNLTINCIRETEWSIHVENTFVETGFLCRSCGNKFHVTTLEKLQHMEDCSKAAVDTASIKSVIDERGGKSETCSTTEPSPTTLAATREDEYECLTCRKILKFRTAVEKLRHKAKCLQLNKTK